MFLVCLIVFVSVLAAFEYGELATIVGSISILLMYFPFISLKCPYCQQPVMRMKFMHTFFYTPFFPKKCCNCSGDLRDPEDSQKV